MKKLPLEYEKRMQTLLSDEFQSYIEALEKSPVKAFRVNTDKISLEEFKKVNEIALEPIPFVENGFYFSAEHIGNHPFHHAGMIYVQEPAAMAPAECIDINPDWKILDMCAAPGGKSTQLKNKLGENGVLISNEIIPSRCKILTGNIERLGLKNTVTTCLDSNRIATVFKESFDLIMVDAPCSGEGMFRKDENAINEWSEENVALCAIRQKEILENAAKALKKGGYIIYATCTFSLDENEKVIDNFLSSHPEFELLPVNERVKKHTSDGISFEGAYCDCLSNARRFYPHKSRGEGQFMALLHNKNDCEAFIPTPAKNEAPDKLVFDFLDEVLLSYKKENVRIYNGNPIYFTPDFPIQKGLAFSCGITIGEIRKNYILPHHQLFMGLGDSFKRKIKLSPNSSELKKYLHGEEIPTDLANGWAVVTVCGCTIGGVKVVNGIAKNHYPKGLRIK